MARKRGLDREAILDAAQDLADHGGAAALSLAELAARLEIKPPSLYAHFDGLGAIREALALRAALALGDALQAAASGAQGEEALRAIARAYRAFARSHPGLYAAVQAGAAPGSELAGAQYAIVAIVASALGRIDLEEGEGVHMVRVLRSALHGFVDLERQGGFGLPEDVEASFERMLDVIFAGIGGARGLRVAPTGGCR